MHKFIRLDICAQFDFIKGKNIMEKISLFDLIFKECFHVGLYVFKSFILIFEFFYNISFWYILSSNLMENNDMSNKLHMYHLMIIKKSFNKF